MAHGDFRVAFFLCGDRCRPCLAAVYRPVNGKGNSRKTARKAGDMMHGPDRKYVAGSVFRIPV